MTFHRLRPYAVYAFLLFLKALTRIFYRFRLTWLPGSDVEGDPWAGMRVVAFLHHTSLFDVLFLGALPNRVLLRFARHGVAPGADVTMERPVVGRLLRFMVHRMISITRRRDATWDAVLDAIDEDALVVLAPEGRMMRRDGLDKDGRPMTVRGGIADVLEAVMERPTETGDPGRLVLAYSQGVHHVQAPEEGLPRIFRTLEATLDSVPITEYVAERRAEAERDRVSFRDAVVRDLEARRDRHCPVPHCPEPHRPEPHRPEASAS